MQQPYILWDMTPGYAKRSWECNSLEHAKAIGRYAPSKPLEITGPDGAHWKGIPVLIEPVEGSPATLSAREWVAQNEPARTIDAGPQS